MALGSAPMPTPPPARKLSQKAIDAAIAAGENPMMGAGATAARRARTAAARQAVAARAAQAAQVAQAAAPMASAAPSIASAATPAAQAAAQAASQARPMIANAAAAAPSIAAAAPIASAAAPSIAAAAADAATSPAAGAAAQTLNMSKYTSGADDAVKALGGNASPLTGIQGIMAKTPLSNAPAWLKVPAGNGTAFGPGSLGRAGAISLGANLANNMIVQPLLGDQKDGPWDDAGRSAANWAAAAAPLAAFGPWGYAAVGAAGLAGGIKGWLTGDDSDSTETRRYLVGNDGMGGEQAKFTQLLDKYGIQGDVRDSLMMQLDIMTQDVTNKDEAKAIIADLKAQIPTAFAGMQQQKLVDEEEAKVAARSAAIQSYLGPMMQRQMDRYNTSAQESSALMSSAARYVQDPTLAGIYKAHAANMLTSSNQAGLGYLAQTAAAPALYGYPTSKSSEDGSAANYEPQNAVNNNNFLTAYKP